MHHPYRHSQLLRLLGFILKIYAFTALSFTIISLTMAIFAAPDFALDFVVMIVPPMTKTGLSLGCLVTIAIALEAFSQ